MVNPGPGSGVESPAGVVSPRRKVNRRSVEADWLPKGPKCLPTSISDHELLFVPRYLATTLLGLADCVEAQIVLVCVLYEAVG